MLQQIQLFLDWLTTAQGSNFSSGLLALAAALGMSGRALAVLAALLCFWMAWSAGGGH